MYRKPRITLLAARLATLVLIVANVPISSADELPASDEPPPAEEAKEIERTPPRLSLSTARCPSGARERRIGGWHR
jgi:hypothetical protein